MELSEDGKWSDSEVSDSESMGRLGERRRSVGGGVGRGLPDKLLVFLRRVDSLTSLLGFNAMAS